MRLKETRRINRPLSEVFEYTADFSNIEKWDPGVAASKEIGDGPVQRGSKFEVDAKFGTSTIPMIYEISVFEPNERVVLIGKGDTLGAVDDIRFREVDGGTVVDYTADLTFLNWVRFAAPLMSPLLRRVGTRALDGLVSALER